MDERQDVFADWTPEQVALARRWVESWKHAGPALEHVRREELRALDVQAALALLCGPGVLGPLRPSSGLVAQQRWFARAVRHP
jgi:hypothetical protein